MRNIWNHSINKRKSIQLPHTRQSVYPVKIKSGIVFQYMYNVSSRLSSGSSSDPEKVHLGAVKVFLSRERKFIRFPVVAQGRLVQSGNSSSVSIHQVRVTVLESLCRYSSSAIGPEGLGDSSSSEPLFQGISQEGGIVLRNAQIVSCGLR